MSAPGPIAQLEERLNGIEEVVGSSPTGSTTLDELTSHCFEIQASGVAWNGAPRASIRRLGLRMGLVRLLRLTTVRLLLVLATAAALMVAAACDGADEQMETAPDAPTAAPDAPAPSPDTTTPTASEPTTGEAPTEIEAAARRLLEQEVGEGNYTLISSEAMDWSDASLGCPKEGFGYAQVITPGYKLVFDLAGASHAVHTNADGSHMVVCPDAPAR